MGKTIKKSFNGRNLQQITRVTKGLCLYKNSDPKRLSAPAPGLYTCIKTWKIMSQIRLQRYFFETCNKWAKWQGFFPQGVVCPCPGAIYMWKNIKKMWIKSEFKEICLKLATNGRSDKGFLLTSKVCPQGVFCPFPRAIYMYKIIKSVCKIRFRRDHFETCNIWAKKKGFSVVIKFLSPMGLCPYLGLYTVKKKTHKKTVKNPTSKQFLAHLSQRLVGELIV